MTILRSHYELETLPGGKHQHTQYLKPIAYNNGGAWARITNVLGDSGDPNLTIGVDELVQFRLRARLAGNSPVFHFGKGQSHVRLTPLDTDNVQGVPAGDNGWLYPAAWPNADLQLVIGGHILRKNIYLRSGHPAQFAFRIDDHANFNPDTLSTPDFRVINPVLENPATGESIGLAWIVSQQGGKYILTCNLPQGNYAGWIFDPTLTLQPDAADGLDASVSEATPDTNYGTTWLLFRCYTVGTRPVLKFNVSSIPPGSNVSSGVLSVYSDTIGSSLHSFSARGLTQPAWTEAGVTWNKYDGASNWISAGGDYAATDYGTLAFNSYVAQFYNCTLTALAQLWVNGSNNGVIFKENRTDTGAATTYGYPSDNITAANRPKLVVEYQAPAANSRIMLLTGAK